MVALSCNIETVPFVKPAAPVTSLTNYQCTVYFRDDRQSLRAAPRGSVTRTHATFPTEAADLGDERFWRLSKSLSENLCADFGARGVFTTATQV